MKSARGEERSQLLSRIVEVRSPWLWLIGERLRDERGGSWITGVEKADSLFVVTVHRGAA